MAAGAKAVFDVRTGRPKARCGADLVVALGGVVMAVIAFLVDDPGDPSSKLEIVEPAGGTADVPFCTAVRVRGAVPSGKALVVANHEDEDDRTYFEAAVDSSAKDDTFTSEAFLGDDGPRSVGRRFTIYAVVLDKQLGRYLASTNTDGGTHWSSPSGDLPPNATIADQVEVKRSADRSEDCDH